MKRNVSQIIATIEGILKELLEEIHGQENIDVNERYIHHYFSYRLQSSQFPIKFNATCKFHPEWATAKLGTDRDAKYRKQDSEYKVDDSGSSGFIDLAIGPIKHPYVGIEFKTSKSYSQEGVIYDYMKLLDRNVKINTAVAIDIYYGRKSKITPDEFGNNLQKAKERLGDRYEESRERNLWVIQLLGTKINVFKCSGNSESFLTVYI